MSKCSSTSTITLTSHSTITISRILPARYNEVFKNANISFLAKKLPDGHITASYFDATAQTDNVVHSDAHSFHAPSLRGHRSLWWGQSFFESTWNAIKSVGAAVETIVVTIIDVVEVLVTGDYDAHMTLDVATWTWNTEDGESSAGPINIDGKITCNDCYMHSELAFKFDLVINDYDIELATLVGEGDMVISAGSSVSVSAGTITNSVRVANLDMGGIHFMIGPVPVVLTATIPIDLGYEIMLSEAASFTIGARFAGSVSYGFTYTTRNGFERISKSEFQHSGGVTDVTVPERITAIVFVKPVVVIQVDHIGGPDIGVKAFLEYVIDKGTQDSWTDPCSGHPKLSMNAGLQATIGAHVNIMDILTKDFGSIAVFSTQLPILAGCLTGFNEIDDDHHLLLSADSQEARDAVFRVVHSSGKILADPETTNDRGTTYGTTWSGLFHGTPSNPKCALFPESRALVVQNLNAVIMGDPMIDVTMVSSDISNAELLNEGVKDFCCIHSAWSFRLAEGGATFLELKSTSGIEDYNERTAQNEADSTCFNTARISASHYYIGTYSENAMSISLTDTLGCASMTLNRVTPGTTGWFLHERLQARKAKKIEEEKAALALAEE
jgi:hypothetical protein